MIRHPLLLLAAWASVATGQDARFDAVSGYRLPEYCGIVSTPLEMARIAAAEVARLVDACRATLIDVVPAEGGVRRSDGTWRMAREERGIPGAAWFLKARRGGANPAVERRFLAGVPRLHARHPKRTLVVFCLADCWMSWNAALKLKRAGDADVRWFAEGADGWRDLGRPLVPMLPYPETR